VENTKEDGLEDERMKTDTKSVGCMRMSRTVLLIVITWKMSGNR